MKANELQTLTAQDLMLGDWVMDTEFDRDVPRRVEIIEPCRVWLLGNMEYQPYRSIQPIPLTSEILEKNGFELYEQDFTSNKVFKFGNFEYIECHDYYEDNRYNYFSIGVYQELKHFATIQRYIRSVMKIFSVHELQHCLKLVGIKKSIVL